MPGWAKRQCILSEDNGLTEVIDRSELLVTTPQKICKENQDGRLSGVTPREKFQYFTIHDNRLVDTNNLASLLKHSNKGLCL